jgi:hypothetical protein
MLTWDGSYWVNHSHVFGDINGSVFGDDSTKIIDGTTGSGIFNNVTIANNLNVDQYGNITSSRNSNIELSTHGIFFGTTSKPVTTITNSNSVEGVYYSTIGSLNGYGVSYQQHLVSRGTLSSPQALQANDLIGAHRLDAYDGNNYRTYAYYGGYVETASVGEVTGGFTVLTIKPDYTPGPRLNFNTSGVLSAPVHKVGSFNGDTYYPSSPAAGMIIFDSSNSHFYGYDGSNWKQLDNS